MLAQFTIFGGLFGRNRNGFLCGLVGLNPLRINGDGLGIALKYHFQFSQLHSQLSSSIHQVR